MPQRNLLSLLLTTLNLIEVSLENRVLKLFKLQSSSGLKLNIITHHLNYEI